MNKLNLKGRCLEIQKQNDSTVLILLNQSGIHKINIKMNSAIHPGDICSIDPEGNVTLLTKNKNDKNPFLFTQNILLNEKKLLNLKMRGILESSLHCFFESEEFLYVRTPLLVSSPGMEPHICPIQIKQNTHQNKENIFLHTSPELAMKKLLVGGLEKIYQLTPCFRSEPFSSTHFPEFTMLEWYRAYENYEKIMEDTENFIFTLSKKIKNSTKIIYQNNEIDLTPPWPKLKVRNLFLSIGIDLAHQNTLPLLLKKCSELNFEQKIPFLKDSKNFDDLYFKIWLNLIEPTLPNNKAVFICDYPASQAALSETAITTDGFPYAKRFELYIAGMEIANAFQELTDPTEQEKRFLEDQKLRTLYYGNTYPKSPIDQEFIDALKEGLPPCSGIALGVDRLVMLFCDEQNIENTFWLKPYY